MTLIGNIIWFIFGGWLLGTIWMIGAVLFALSIVGIPVSRAAFELGSLAYAPFGRKVIRLEDLDGSERPVGTAFSLVVNLLWAVFFGWMLAVGHLIQGLVLCVTIVFLPFGLQAIKLARFALWPVGRRVRDAELVDNLRGTVR